MGQDSGTQPSSPRLADVLVPLASSLALIGAVAYAVMRYSYEQFYDRFGVGMGDVGATPSTIVAESSAGALVFVILFGVVPLALSLGAFWFSVNQIAHRRGGRLASFAGGCAVAVVVLGLFQRWSGGALASSSFIVLILTCGLLWQRTTPAVSSAAGWRDWLRAQTRRVPLKFTLVLAFVAMC